MVSPQPPRPPLLGGTVTNSSRYAYDRLYRLTEADGPFGRTSYAYGPVGKRTRRTRGGTTIGYRYDRADRLQRADEIEYTVDKSGRTTAREGPTTAPMTRPTA